MLQADACVVTIANVPEVIDVLLEGGIIFVVEVLHAVSIERAVLLNVMLDLLLDSHKKGVRVSGHCRK